MFWESFRNMLARPTPNETCHLLDSYSYSATPFINCSQILGLATERQETVLFGTSFQNNFSYSTTGVIFFFELIFFTKSKTIGAWTNNYILQTTNLVISKYQHSISTPTEMWVNSNTLMENRVKWMVSQHTHQ